MIVITQTELVDVAAVRHLLAVLSPNHRDRKRLEKILKTQVNGAVVVNYHYAKSLTFGRMYSDNGVLCLKSTTRTELTKDLYVDIGMVLLLFV
jgi:hypothetical protein